MIPTVAAGRDIRLKGLNLMFINISNNESS